MDLEYVVRFATEADLEEIVHHRRGMFEDMGFTDEKALEAMQQTSRAFLENGLKTGSYRGWLAEAPDGTVLAGVGMILYPWVSHPLAPQNKYLAYVLNMYVHHGYRRQGIARKLMAAVTDWSREQGLSVVSLHASDQGRPLYESLGFQGTNEMRLVVRGTCGE